MLDPITDVLATRAGALRYPKQAAAALSAASDVNSVITGDILGTIAGVLRFPNEAADALAVPPNLLLNPELAGAVSGSPGTPPTNWTYNSIGTPAVVASVGSLQITGAGDRLTVVQAYAMIVGTYRWEANINVNASREIQDLISVDSFDTYQWYLDGTPAAYNAAVNGAHLIRIDVGITTPRSINLYFGLGLTAVATAVATYTNLSLTKTI